MSWIHDPGLLGGDTADGPLGPLPVRTVAVLADLGLDDGEMARYFGVGVQDIARLRGMAEAAEGLRDGPDGCLRSFAPAAVRKARRARS